MITRFAPAPTGYLHLGHVVSALAVWGEAERAGAAGNAAEVLLRIEDHDRGRSRLEYERAILEDLAWLGFEPDRTVPRQSDRGDDYLRALHALRGQGLVYVCECSRSDLDAPEVPGGERRYPGTCAHKNLADGPGRSLRVRLEPSVERFVDRRLGPQEQQPSAQCGDLLLRDRNGNWTYQFCAVVDDCNEAISLVVRGEDLLASTGRQILLARLLGRREPPEFLHHALVMKAPGSKLSKSDGDTGVRELRAKGWTAADVIRHARSLIS
jgi:glutamyl/glutaminyl-tRNA synthetase